MAYRLENKETLINSDVVIGVKFPFNGNKVFNETFTTLEQTNSNIKNLLLTGRGERYLLHRFGTTLKFLLFEQQTDELKIAIDEEVRSAVNKWLPYVTINSIVTEFDTPENSSIRVKLTYTVSNIGAEQSLTISTENDNTIKIES